MKYYLVVYNRSRRAIEDITEYDDADEAIRARFHLEAAASDDDEVVVLGAESEAALHRTHGRYFGVLPELTGVG